MNRLQDAVRRLSRVASSLEEIEALAAIRSLPDRDPLEAYLAGESVPWLEAAPRLVIPAAPARKHSRTANLGRRTVRAARAGALPFVFAGTLSLFGLIRLQPANTLWSQELTLTSRVETGEFHCDPLALEFVGLTHAATGRSTLTYALKGGGTSGFGCPPKDISNLAIPVGQCFDTALNASGIVVAETHPGSGTSAWKYAPKNSSNPRLVKWDSQTTSAPLGGRGTFDPAIMRFSFTLNADLQTSNLTDVVATYKAGTTEASLGTVKAPACPLPVASAPLTSKSSAPVTDAPVAAPPEEDPPAPTQTPEPEQTKGPGPAGPVNIAPGPENPRKATPTPTPKLDGFMISSNGPRP